MTAPEPLKSGLDLSAVDPSIRIQDDLFGHMNGRWLATHEIPADRAIDGEFRRLRDEAEADVRAIVEECAADTEAPADSPQGRIGALYRSFMDEVAIEKAGAEPLQPLLTRILSATTHRDLAQVMSAPDMDTTILALYVWTNDADSSRYQVKATQAGLGLPDESYYREDQYASIRDAYVKHLATLAELASLPGRDGLVEGSSSELASAVMELEHRIAACHVDVVRARDREASQNPMTAAERSELAKTFPWDELFAGTQAPHEVFEVISVHQPEYVSAVAQVFAETDVPVLRTWLALHTISSYAPYLSSDFVSADFAFRGTVLAGTEQLRERWKRGVALVEGSVGFDLGQFYVQRHFPPSHKARMHELVAALMDAYRESISNLEWMTAATREKALEKLATFTPKIGYPDQWRSYEGLTFTENDLLGNVIASRRYESEYQFAKVLGPVDEHEWHMTPQTVNAYYNPGRNEIAFPAAFLQPPFFNAEAEDAVNFGGIGAVIGHEVGHGFDDQGSKYDPYGNLVSWWTDEDRAAFDERTSALIAQYDQLSPRALDDEHTVNGAFTVGENIGDLGGLSIAVKAYLRSGGADAPELDGFTPLQRVFLAWATVWREKARDQEAIRRLAVDPHSPSEFRCNTTASNVPQFHEAFDVQPGDGMYRAPEERVAIW